MGLFFCAHLTQQRKVYAAFFFPNCGNPTRPCSRINPVHSSSFLQKLHEFPWWRLSDDSHVTSFLPILNSEILTCQYPPRSLWVTHQTPDTSLGRFNEYPIKHVIHVKAVRNLLKVHFCRPLFSIARVRQRNSFLVYIRILPWLPMMNKSEAFLFVRSLFQAFRLWGQRR